MSSAVGSADGRVVTLTTTGMTTGPVTLRVRDVRDRVTVPNIAPPTVTAFGYSDASSGTGLTATYFSNNNFTGTPLLTRVEPQIDFNYGISAPAPGVPADNFAVRWSGQLQPRFNENYTIFARTDDGVRVFIDGRLVISQWTNQGPTEVSATLPLDSSRTHDIVVEYYEATGGAVAQLSWQSASQPKQIIPQAFLRAQSLLTTVRTFDGAGADTTLNRVNPTDNGTSNAMGVFHSPAAGAFHDAAYFRFDLAPFNLASNMPVDGVVTLSQTFFGIGSGKRLINFFGVRQSAGGDNWVETGPGHVTWNSAAGNDQSGSQASATSARWLSTFLLDNAGFQNNNQPDKAFIRGQRVVDMINDDTDGLVTLLLKRYDASNEGQSWFTKEWNIPGAAPALKLELAPRCPTLRSQPAWPASVDVNGNAAIVASVRGAGTIAYQWKRDGNDIADGAGGAAPGGGTVFGAAGVITDAARGADVGLTITGLQPQDAGSYTLTLTNTCGTATSVAADLSIAIVCDDIDFNNNDVFPEDQDITDFFNVLAGGECPECNDIDFNNNGVFPEDQDVADFFNVLAGGTCP